MPDHIKLFDILTTFDFWCEPFIDVYYTDTANNLMTDTLYDFQNKYISIEQPVYVAGYQAYLSQSREEFYQQYPIINSIESIGSGDGMNQNFSGTLTATPILRNQVTFSSVDINNNALCVADDGGGVLKDPIYGTSSGFIDYISGNFSITWATPPGSGVQVNSQTVPYVASRPVAMLYYDNKFTLRPVPDQSYKVNFEVYMRPVAILAGNNPQIQDWWQYIAYGAAKKIFENRMQPDFVAMIMPEFRKQECLVMRKSIVNQTKERTATIFSEQTAIGANPFGWNRMY
jgi:hypothetical protein